MMPVDPLAARCLELIDELLTARKNQQICIARRLIAEQELTGKRALALWLAVDATETLRAVLKSGLEPPIDKSRKR